MSPLRSQYVAFLQLRGYSDKTVRNYVQSMKQFQDWLGKSPIHMNTDSVRQYLIFLKRNKKLAARTINIHLYALKAFNEFFLPESAIMTPFKRLKTPVRQVKIISSQQAIAMIESTINLKHKAIIMVLYSAGLRVDECINLKVADIDSNRMVIHVMGKGQRERYALLSPRTRAVLRDYYRRYRPTNWLFSGQIPGSHIGARAVGEAVRNSALRAFITTPVTPHIMRHSFATHLLERGESLLVIQRLLGHANVSTTAIYTRVSTDMLRKVKSPLDTPPPQPPTDHNKSNTSTTKKHRRPGRPKGSKNKRKPGRPKGSKNKIRNNRKGGRK